MPESTRIRLIALGALVAFIALLLPPIFYGRADRWGLFIYDYQTLLTGLLAIAAAAITADQVHRSDLAQEKRHRETMQVALRPDRLIVERAINPAYRQLCDCEAGLWHLTLAITRQKKRDAMQRYVQDHVEELNRLITEVLKILDSSALKEAKRLFSGQMNFRIEELSDMAKQIAEIIARAKVVYKFDVDTPRETHDLNLIPWGRVVLLTVLMDKNMPHTTEHFRILAGEYDVAYPEIRIYR